MTSCDCKEYPEALLALKASMFSATVILFKDMVLYTKALKLFVIISFNLPPATS